MMKAVIVEKPGDENSLKLGEVLEPAIKPDEILIRVHAAGVNRADILQRQGFYPPPPGASEIIGMECAGEVAAVGAAVTGWKIGDRAMALIRGGRDSGSLPDRVPEFFHARRHQARRYRVDPRRRQRYRHLVDPLAQTSR